MMHSVANIINALHYRFDYLQHLKVHYGGSGGLPELGSRHYAGRRVYG